MGKNASTAGFSIAFLVIWFGVIAHTANREIFFDAHAMIVVLGGTIAAGLIAFPFRRFREILKFIVYAVIYPQKFDKKEVIADIMRMAGVTRQQISPQEFQQASHPFLAEGYRLVRKRQFSANELKAILIQRNQYFKEHYQSDAKMLNTLAKFPPAFGLLGATTGMIALMSNLGTGGQDTIGPSMAVALVATFWGIALANFVILPLADHARRVSENQVQLRFLIITGLMLVYQGASIELIYEHLVGFLPLEERQDEELVGLKTSLAVSYPNVRPIKTAARKVP